MADLTCASYQNPFITEITTVLSESAQAKVLLGKQVDNGKIVVVKVPYLDHDDSKRQREVELLARATKKIFAFDHANIVRHFHEEIGMVKTSAIPRFNVLDSQFTRVPQYHIVMEFCSGGTLHDLLKTSSLTAILVQKWTHQLVSGLAYLHDQRFAHKDLKGDHIFLSSLDLNTCSLKIGGLVNLKQLLPSTATSMYCGDVANKASSFAFMAPETITGSEVEVEPAGETKKLGRRSDLWSLGCVLIQMITRTLPRFLKQNGGTVTAVTGELAIVYFVGSGGSPTIPSNIPVVVRHLIEQCLARDPNDRPTADTLLQHPFFSCSADELENWILPSQAG
ncbi:uncharacterized protein LOC129585334 [Paramacrobiotus metropolitanus]|uniref:uncharacterized protein LOC129585334 n=1 Tax=Paramacrobiotus metropolitanus TaxID=2943436 RepID=UPI002445E46F|nr:uncharacterized protein LOC129585334 [Paramacrobiotus metropolitanus]